MTITDWVLVFFIMALLAFAIYDQFIMPRRHGTTLLSIPFCVVTVSMVQFSSVSSRFLSITTSTIMVHKSPPGCYRLWH